MAGWQGMGNTRSFRGNPFLGIISNFIAEEEEELK